MMDFNYTEQAILKAIFKYGFLTKRELCKITSSSWAGISKYVSKLQKYGLLECYSPEKTFLPGRPSNKINFSNRILLSGVSVSYNKVKGVVCDTKGNILKSLEKKITRDDDPAPECIKLLKHLFTPDIKKRIISLGVSFPGIVDSSKRMVINSIYFSEFYNRRLAEEFEIALQMDIPVFIERNAVCELHGMVVSNKIDQDTLLISFNSGISAAIFLDGKILKGKTGNMASLGHSYNSINKIPCLCGEKGCIDTIVGEVAWERDYRKISKLPGSGDSFYSALESGLPEAVKMLKTSLEKIHIFLNPLMRIFKPENLIFSADLPPSSALVFATSIKKAPKNSISDIIFADKYTPTKGAAIMGFSKLFD